MKIQSLSSLVLSLTYFFQFLGREKGLYAQIHQSSSTPILSRTATTSGRTGSGSLSCPAASCRSPGSPGCLNSSLNGPNGHNGPQPPTNDSYARSSSGPGTAHDHSRVPHARGVARGHAHGRAHDDHGGGAAPGHDDGRQAPGHAPDASSCSTSNDGYATHGSNDEASVCKSR